MTDPPRNLRTPLGSILGHGIDLVEIDAFHRMLGLADEHALARYFTPSELEDAGDGATRIGKLAGRLAVKEAVLKALGLGWGDGISFVDVEIVVGPLGQPDVVLHRSVKSVASDRRIRRWFVSTSHTASTAVASVIALGE